MVSAVLLYESRACGGERIELADPDNDLCPLVPAPAPPAPACPTVLHLIRRKLSCSRPPLPSGQPAGRS